MPGNWKDITGQRFGKLVAQWPVGMEGKGWRRNVVWLCACDCGTVRYFLGIALRSGHFKSCNCARGFGRLPKGEAAFNLTYRHYRKGARTQRGMVFDLSKEEFRTLTQSNCFYCGTLPSQVTGSKIKQLNGIYMYNGVDRKDSSVGYVSTNCVPCCWTCNRAKAGLSFDDFQKYLDRFRDQGRSWPF